MKKSIQKLTLNKITISNLDKTEMTKVDGGKPKYSFPLKVTCTICPTYGYPCL